jgi:hypothetical protein
MMPQPSANFAAVLTVQWSRTAPRLLCSPISSALAFGSCISRGTNSVVCQNCSQTACSPISNALARKPQDEFCPKDGSTHIKYSWQSGFCLPPYYLALIPRSNKLPCLTPGPLVEPMRRRNWPTVKSSPDS